MIPIGFTDGYSPTLGHRGRVFIRGRSASVVGRVCSKILSADGTDIPDLSIGDEVVLIDRQGNNEILAEEIAPLSHAITNEFLTRLAPGNSPLDG